MRLAQAYVAELEAEIERLQRRIAHAHDELRVINEELRAEVERLQEEVAQAKRYETCLHENLVAHELANERLKAALREIADIENLAISEGNYRAIARAALEGKP